MAANRSILDQRMRWTAQACSTSIEQVRVVHGRSGGWNQPQRVGVPCGKLPLDDADLCGIAELVEELFAVIPGEAECSSYAARCRLARPLDRVVRRDDFSVNRPVTNLCSTLAMSVWYGTPSSAARV